MGLGFRFGGIRLLGELEVDGNLGWASNPEKFSQMLDSRINGSAYNVPRLLLEKRFRNSGLWMLWWASTLSSDKGLSSSPDKKKSMNLKLKSPWTYIKKNMFTNSLQLFSNKK